MLKMINKILKKLFQYDYMKEIRKDIKRARKNKNGGS